MLLAAGQAAATLVPAINAVNAEIATVETYVANSAVIIGGNIVVQDPTANPGGVGYGIQTLTVAESATVFNTVLSILQARLTALNAQLASL